MRAKLQDLGPQDINGSNNHRLMHKRGKMSGLQGLTGLKHQLNVYTEYHDWTSGSHGLETPV